MVRLKSKVYKHVLFRPLIPCEKSHPWAIFAQSRAHRAQNSASTRHHANRGRSPLTSEKIPNHRIKHTFFTIFYCLKKKTEHTFNTALPNTLHELFRDRNETSFYFFEKLQVHVPSVHVCSEVWSFMSWESRNWTMKKDEIPRLGVAVSGYVDCRLFEN